MPLTLDFSPDTRHLLRTVADTAEDQANDARQGDIRDGALYLQGAADVVRLILGELTEAELPHELRIVRALALAAVHA